LSPIDSLVDRAAKEFALRLKAIATEEPASTDARGNGVFVSLAKPDKIVMPANRELVGLLLPKTKTSLLEGLVL
jgi:hypothetical protein